ncbi:hypothetical protein [Cellulomonas massiliensis]|uniref:hypothetical protein n=1 Tax=Cellulomonas massiliensis TaxID=1465811 RepID=UPI0011C873CF|nr:hypothetical protein [Cellulomonas massiliensis]
MPREAVAATVRRLWEAGDRHGRPPEPTPEVDPWDEGDPYPEPSATAAVVVFAGAPSITVRLAVAGPDVVLVEDVVDFEVPRADTVALVEALLGGRARLTTNGRRVARWVAALFAGALATVRVPVEGGRAYTAPVPTFAWSSWVGSLPIDP